MPIRIKKEDTGQASGGSWVSIKRLFVKASDGLWKSATRVFAKTANGWVQMWPGNAPAVNPDDPINIRSGGYNGTVVGSPQYINAVLYGHDGNGNSISGDTPITIDYRKMKVASDDTGQTTRYELESVDIYNLTSNSETRVGEKRFYADGWWLFYELSATNVWAPSILYSFPPIKIIRRIPVVNSNTLSEDYSFPTLPSFGFNFTISDLWYEAADWSRSYVRWWLNTSKTPGGTILQTDYLDTLSGATETRSGGLGSPNYEDYNGTGTTYNNFSVYVRSSAVPAGYYVIAELVLQNSYTDHYGTPVSVYKSTGDRPVINSITVRDDNGNGVVDNQSTPRIISDGYLTFTAIVTGASATDYYLLEPRFYNRQNGLYYRWDTIATQDSTAWPVDLTPTSSSLNGTTATVTWRTYIDANALYAVGAPTYGTSNTAARWSLEWRVSTRTSSSIPNSSATYFVGFPDLGSGVIVYDPDDIGTGADRIIAPSSAMTLNVSSTNVQQGNSITFSGSTVSYPSGYTSFPRRYQIDFGDGTTYPANGNWETFSTGTSNPSFSGITKTYNTPGTYIATLKWDPQGDPGRSTRSRTITVAPPLSPPTSVSVANVTRYSNTETRVDLSHSGGSGPYYQMYWVASSTTPTTASYDAASNSSTDSISEAFAFATDTTYYFYVRSSSENIATTFNNGTGTAGTYSAYSNISPANPSYTFQHPSGSISIPSPSVAGTTLQVTPSISGLPSPNISYEWQYFEGGSFGWVTIATGTSYTPPSNYVTLYGSLLRCYATANNGVSSSGGTQSYFASATSTITAPATKLATPTNVTASSNRSDGVQVSWTNVANASTYGVWWGGVPDYNNSPDFGGPNNNGGKIITSSPFLDDAISAGSSRTYYVQAFPSTGSTAYLKSDWSSPGQTGTRLVPVPNATAPTSVTATGGNGSVTVSWSGATNAAKYRIWWSTNPNGNAVDPASNYDGQTTHPTTSTSFSLTNGTTYYFWVSASNTNDVWTSYSSSPRGQATPSAPVSIPSGGSVSLSGSNTAGSVITANTSGWSGSPTSYDVYITTTTAVRDPVSTDSRVASSNGLSSVTYTITSSDAISPVNRFRAFATASNTAGTSTPVVQSANTIVTAQSGGGGGGGGGAAPVLVSITGNNSLAVGGTFSWSFSNSPTSYSVFVQGPTGTNYTTSNQYTYTGTSFRPGYDGFGWQGSGNYTIYVSARNSSGDSAVASVTTFMS